MTAATKTDAFAALRSRLYMAGLELYEEPDLIAELRRLRTRYAAGRASVENPHVGGSHGDMAQALALAVREHDRHGTAGWSSGPDVDVRRYDDGVGVGGERPLPFGSTL